MINLQEHVSFRGWLLRNPKNHQRALVLFHQADAKAISPNQKRSVDRAISIAAALLRRYQIGPSAYTQKHCTIRDAIVTWQSSLPQY